MDQIETILVSGRIVAEFGDDASQFLSGEAEFVGIPEKKGVTPAAYPVPQETDMVPSKPS